MHMVRWSPRHGRGMEHLVVRHHGGTISAQGVLIGERGNLRYGASYAIECDNAWRVRHAVIAVAGGARLELYADGAGHWHGQDGAPIASLDGCIDIDLTASCFTNTLPIRRLGGAPGERRVIDVAWVWIPELGVEAAPQAYTLLADGRYRFEGIGTGFQADLTVDGEGFVVDYPGLFLRVD